MYLSCHHVFIKLAELQRIPPILAHEFHHVVVSLAGATAADGVAGRKLGFAGVGSGGGYTPTACPVVCDAALEPRGYLERRGAGRTASLVTLPVHDVLHVLNAQHDRDTLIEEFRAVGGARIMA